MWPTFTIIDVEANGAPVGSINFVSVGDGTWVGDRYHGYLKMEDSLISGKWHSQDVGWKFVPEVPAEFVSGQSFYVLDSYWGERVLIATDVSLFWINHSWDDINDHAHCAICWAKISTVAEPNYYQSSSNERVCATCYRDHVSQRDISFVPVA